MAGGDPQEPLGLRQPRAPLIRYICATLATEDVARVQKQIYRFSRGKVISMVYSLEGTSSLTSKPETAQKIRQNRSVIFAAYPSMANMDQSMRKVDELLETLGANRVNLSDATAFRDRLSSITGRIEDLKQVIPVLSPDVSKDNESSSRICVRPT